MKIKLFAVAAAAALMMTLSSCGGGDKYSKCSVVTADTPDAVIYDVGELFDEAELIVSAKVTEDKGSCGGGYTAFDAEVLTVEKGEVSVGDVIGILQHFEVKKKTLTSCTGSKPLQKDDRWLFFLKKDEAGSGYLIVGDTSGKLPVPNSNDMQCCGTAQVVYSEREKFLSMVSGEMTEGNKSSLAAYNARLSSLYDTIFTAERMGNYEVTLEQQEVMYNVTTRMLGE